MSSRTHAVLSGAVFALLQCEQSPEVNVPNFPDGGLLRTGSPLLREQLLGFEGMFRTSEGASLFGDQVAVRTSPGTVSVLTDKNAGFAVLGAACLPDRRVVAEGYWRYPTRPEAGLVRVFVEPPDFAEALCRGELVPAGTNLHLKGYYGEDDEFPRSPLDLSWSRELRPWRGRFFTVAHHGACENTEHCGASPNGLETIRLAERVGSNAAEVDVRITRDGVPILFHDPGLSKSLVRGLFCNGQVADLSFAELRGSCELRHGELIPTVEEALQMMVEETELEGAYLDIKVPEAVLPTARIVSRLVKSLEERNSNDDPGDDRTFSALVAIPDDDVRSAWHDAKAALAREGLDVPPCLVEDDPDVVLSEGCVAWGPAWTAGPQVEDVRRLREAGAGTIFWTINQSDFVDEFLTRAVPDGIITSRAALVFYRYQTIGTPPPERSP